MPNVNRKSLIIIGCILALVIASCGYSIVKKSMAGQVVFDSESNVNKYPQGNDGEVNKPEEDGKTSKSKEILVHVIGQVRKPGLVRIPEGSRISDAVEVAGGALEDADLEVINLAYKLQDGKQVYIPSKDERPPDISGEDVKSRPAGASPAKDSGSASETLTRKPQPGVQPDVLPPRKAPADSSGVIGENHGQAEAGGEENTLVNINTAGLEQLDRLPGIGPSTAQKIIDYRSKNGLFKAPQDIMKVNGIGDSKYEKIKDRITI